MSATRFQLGAGGLIIAGAITALTVQHRTQQTLRAQNESMARQIAQLKADNTELSNRLSATANSQPLTDGQLAELLKLRAELTRLRAMPNPPVATESVATNAVTKTNKLTINLRAKFVSVPAGDMQALGSAWAPAGNGASLLSENQMASINQAMKESGDIHLISAPQVITSSGTQAQVSMFKSVPVNGTNADIGTFLDVLPYYSPESSVFTLNLAAQLKQLSGDPSAPGLVTTIASNQVTLFPGQTIVLQEDLPSNGWLPDSENRPDEPEKLLVFVTPKIGNETQKPESTQSAADVAIRNAAIEKMDDAKQGMFALLMFASDNQDNFPTNLTQASRYFKDGSGDSVETNFDMVYSGPIAGITNPATTRAISI